MMDKNAYNRKYYKKHKEQILAQHAVSRSFKEKSCRRCHEIFIPYYPRQVVCQTCIELVKAGGMLTTAQNAANELDAKVSPLAMRRRRERLLAWIREKEKNEAIFFQMYERAVRAELALAMLEDIYFGDNTRKEEAEAKIQTCDTNLAEFHRVKNAAMTKRDRSWRASAEPTRDDWVADHEENAQVIDTTGGLLDADQVQLDELLKSFEEE